MHLCYKTLQVESLTRFSVLKFLLTLVVKDYNVPV